MRTFIALTFNRDLKNRLGTIQRTLKENSFRGRWVYIDNFHMTLKFLGNIDPLQINEIKSKLGDISKKNYEVKLAFDQLGYFTGKDILRVVWLGVKGDIAQLKQLQREVDWKMKDLGFSKERRKFRPHITLGRDVIFNKTIININEQIYNDIKYNFVLDTIELMKSEEVEGKRVYTPLASFKLRKKGR